MCDEVFVKPRLFPSDFKGVSMAIKNPLSSKLL
ncbi:MAG: hypothetical protein ACJAYY_002425 [Paraglaciecola sp.]|jgi:hypothetical protein